MKARIQANPASTSNGDALNRDAQACSSHLPAGTPVPRFRSGGGRPGGGGDAVRQCLSQALANVPRGPGTSPSALQQAFANATAICRALSRGSGSAPGGQTTTATIPSGTVPPAKA
jgi:hypothetical protein